MCIEDQILLACARQNFTADHRCRVEDVSFGNRVDWSLVYAAAALHNVGPLIAANLQQCDPQAIGIPSAIWAQFEAGTLRSIALTAHMEAGLQQVLGWFAAHAIDIMLIKGAALGMLVYAEPWYTLHDVDLVIRPRRAELGPALGAAIDQLFAGLPGFEYDFWAHHDVTMNGVLPVEFARIWAAAQRITWRGQPVTVMCPEDMLLAVCINSCRKHFTRLKSLVDTAEIIAKHPGLDWDAVIERAHAFDCRGIVYAALYAAQLRLSTALDEGELERILARLDVAPLRARAIHSLLARTSPAAYAAEQAGRTLFGRSVNRSLLLPYATLRWGQIGRRMRFVWRTRALGATAVLPGLGDAPPEP